ncbi:hypothetical protein F0U44_10735 [Nocardioides humilatus]|uniref:Bacterial Ig-like domain-containing protein n=1 Tax=Nocardioides humilatus TaxID=2607660 RepID=A0A5B1LGK7_9ACTN|nr:hypothetical protein [Nocardioides humilatus]KAA1418940.1 hypothetical protein F0U44_10735 [Nocardioides humilatus]
MARADGEADTTPPTVQGVPDRDPDSGFWIGDEGRWYTDDVTISWRVTDADPSSGIVSRPAAQVISDEGVHRVVSDEACDAAGNCATGAVTVGIDKTGPIVELFPRPNDEGWYTAPTTVTLLCRDLLSGIVTCANPVALTGGDSHVSGTVADVAGNTTPYELKLDATLPDSWVHLPYCIEGQRVCAGSLYAEFGAADSEGSSGVKEIHYRIEGDGAAEEISGVLPPNDGWDMSGIWAALNPEGGTVKLTHWAVDRAGNVGTPRVGYATVDAKAPTIRAIVHPAPNAAGWNNTTVMVAFDCRDESYGHWCVPRFPDWVYVDQDTPGRTVTGNAGDPFGHRSSLSLVIKRDTQAPTATISRKEGRSVSGTAGDTLSGVKTVTVTMSTSGLLSNYTKTDTVTCDGGTSCTWSVTLPRSLLTKWHIVAVATDVADNASAPVRRTFGPLE